MNSFSSSFLVHISSGTIPAATVALLGSFNAVKLTDSLLERCRCYKPDAFLSRTEPRLHGLLIPSERSPKIAM
jgi:hypothetical protein